MLPDEPQAYLLTWTLKGARLHGDPRGSVDRERRGFGQPLAAPDPARVALEARQMKQPLASLDRHARELVARTVAEVAQRRGWAIHALAVQSTHVHVVVGAQGFTPERAMNDLKAWSTRRLREAGIVAADGRPWARHGSTRYLWKDEPVAAAIAYVEEGQDVPR